jgi:ribosome-associated protein
MTSEVATERAAVAVAAIEDKQGRDVRVLDVGDIISITEVFVVAHGTNSRQVRTIVDEVERRLLTDCEAKPRSREGRDDASWVLLDYGDLVVHVFLEETRDHYGLDRLWADAPRLELARRGNAAGTSSGTGEAATG